MNWRAIPLALKCALILQVIEIVAGLTYTLADTYKQAPRFFLAEEGLTFAIMVLGAIGTLDLARTQTGTARTGAWIAFAGFLGALALSFAWSVIECKESWLLHRTLFEVLGYVYFATKLAAIVGLAIATRKLGLAIAGIVVGLACSPPPFIDKHLFEALKDSGRITQALAQNAMRFGHTAVLLVFAGFAARGEMDTPDPRRAVWGFRMASKAMWVRVFATCAVPLLMLFALMGRSEGAAKMLQFAMVATIAVGLWSMTQFAVGALAVARSRVTDMGRLSFLCAGVGSLWCAGLALSQFPKLFRVVYGDGEVARSYLTEDLEAWSVVGPIVAIAAIALVVGGIAGFAGRRLQNELHTQASSKGVAFVILMFATIAIQQWVLPKATSEGSGMFLLLCALVAGLAGTVMMANLCTLAADAVEREPGLPTATVV